MTEDEELISLYSSGGDDDDEGERNEIVEKIKGKYINNMQDDPIGEEEMNNFDLHERLLASIYHRVSTTSNECSKFHDNIVIESSDVDAVQKDMDLESHLDTLLSHQQQSTSTTNRYFVDATESKGGGPMCYQCQQRGHIRVECPLIQKLTENAKKRKFPLEDDSIADLEEDLQLICVLCGKKGHLKMSCPQEICFTCRGLGHTSKTCPNPSGGRRHEYSNSGDCPACALPYHDASTCSVLLWRQYYLIPTSISALPSPRQVELAYMTSVKSCYLCASNKHFGDDCPRKERLRLYGGFGSSSGQRSMLGGSIEGLPRSLNPSWSAFNEYSHRYVLKAIHTPFPMRKIIQNYQSHNKLKDR